MTAKASSQERLRAFIDNAALDAGFDVVAVTGPELSPETASRLAQYIEDGRHGTMDWMPETAERRSSPKALWPEVKSVIMLGMNYGPEDNPLGLLERPDRGAISVYARNRDYHDIMKGRLKQIAGQLAARTKQDVKVFVDTAPVMEKPLAAAAGLGWQGKHTNLVSRKFGSWLFLGSIFTTAEIKPDLAEVDHCGKCHACLSACPTNAFPAPYQIDARRCISYLTIENKGPIPHEFRPMMGNRIYGCDDCLAVCPWNKFAQNASEIRLMARDDLKEPELAHFLTLDDAEFRSFFSGSPVKRIGRDRFLRNVLIAVGNSRMQLFIPSCLGLLKDASALVRGAAIWALGQLMEPAELQQLAQIHAADEKDVQVKTEWTLALERSIGSED